ncbi:MAG: hypothetical protein NTZ09_04210 [Candidatus Hydrogenedentes bacterium]|nr:hypothetical protein [Candidatus Hydrogenedentota bacterium]
MKTQLVFDDGAYDRLMAEVVAIKNIAYASKRDMKPYLHERLERSVGMAKDILVDEVKEAKS